MGGAMDGFVAGVGSDGMISAFAFIIGFGLET
jgi:cysteine synthase